MFIKALGKLPHLVPQFVLGKHHRFTLSLIAFAKNLLPSNVRMLRQESSWNSGDTMRYILCELAKALCGYTVLLLMDVASCHLVQSVTSLAHKLGIRIILVPARLTFLVQPLDTVYFLILKRALKHNYLLEIIRQGGGPLSVEAWLLVVLRSIVGTISSQDWSQAFKHNGITATQWFIRPSILLKMGLIGPLKVPSVCPSADDLVLLLPSNRSKLNMQLYLKSYPSPVACNAPDVVQAVAPEVPPTSSASSSPVAPLRWRLRMLPRMSMVRRTSQQTQGQQHQLS